MFVWVIRFPLDNPIIYFDGDGNDEDDDDCDDNVKDE